MTFVEIISQVYWTDDEASGHDLQAKGSNLTTQVALQLQLVVRHDHSGGTTTRTHVLVSVPSGATVDGLLKGLIRYAKSTSKVSADGAILALGVLEASGSPWNVEAGQGEYWTRLPQDALVADCGLLSGDEVLVAHPSQMAGSRRSISVDSLSETELLLVDEVGPMRGRVSRVLPTESVLVGRHPTGEQKLVLDDDTIGDTCVRLERESESVVRVDRLGETPVRVSGELGDGRLHVGSTLRVGERNLLLATTREGLSGRSPLGKVRFDPTAREALWGYPRFAETLEPEVEAAPRFRDGLGRVATGFIPSVLMGLFMVIISHQLYFLVMIVVHPVVSLFGHFQEWRSGRAATEKRKEDWTSRRKAQLGEFVEAVQLEAYVRNTEAGDLLSLLDAVHNRSERLWRKRIQDRDFLVLKLGKADIMSALRPDTSRLSDTERQSIESSIDASAMMRDVVVSVNLSRFNLAVVGAPDQTSPMIGNMLMQILINHSPGSVGVAAFLPRTGYLLNRLDWLKWVPHFQSASTLLPPEPLALGRARCDALLRQISDALEGNDPSASPEGPHAVLIVHESSEVDRDQLANVIRRAGSRLHMIWIGFDRERVSSAADLIFSVDSESIVHVSGPARGSFDYPDRFRVTKQLSNGGHIDDDLADKVGQRLTALYDPSASGRSAGLPVKLPLRAILGTPESHVSGRLASSELVAPVGVSDGGPLSIDFVKDGPHMLVGGTTGAGKSDFLRTLIASLAWSYPPAEVSFILVDFKGGAAFDSFKRLPHVNGFVRDLDGNNIERMLLFLRREIRRREEQFQEDAERGWPTAKNYEDYRKTRGSGANLPRLVLVVDEFATLVEESPKFMKGVVDIAQRGRALGLHMILATQQPSGDVIDSKVRANVGLKISLRTVDSSNSELIIGAPDGALISRSTAGRGFIRRGTDPLVEFQTAYGGDPMPDSEVESGVLVQEFRIGGSADREPLTDEEEATEMSGGHELDGDAATLDGPVTTKLGEDSASELDVFMERLSAQPRALCPELGDRLGTFRELLPRHVGLPDDTEAIGWIDEPASQAQRPFLPALNEGSLLLLGPMASGKTLSLAVVAERYLVDRPHGYVVAIDSAGGGLDQALDDAGLAARCVVVSGGDLQDVSRTIDRLGVMMDLGERTDGLLLIDGLASLCESLMKAGGRRWVDQLLTIVSTGKRVGLVTAVTASLRSELPLDVRGAFRHVIDLMRSPGSEERVVGGDPGIGSLDDRFLVQLFSPSKVPVLEASNSARGRRGWFAEGTAPDELLRSIVSTSSAVRVYRDDVFGVEVEVFRDDRPMLVCGKSRSGRTAALMRLSEAVSDGRTAVLSCRPGRGEEWPASANPISVESFEELGALASQTDEATAVAAWIAALSLGERPVIIIDDAHFLKKSGNFVGAVEACVRSGLIRIALSSDIAAAQYDGWRSLSIESDKLVLQPAPADSTRDEGELVANIGLRQRPSAKYNAGSGIFITQEGQVRVSCD